MEIVWYLYLSEESGSGNHVKGNRKNDINVYIVKIAERIFLFCLVLLKMIFFFKTQLSIRPSKSFEFTCVVKYAHTFLCTYTM